MRARKRNLPAYADALVALGTAAGTLPELEYELVSLRDFVQADVRLQRFLADPVVRSEGKQAALRDILTGHVSEMLLHFLMILQAEGCLGKLEAIADEFFRKTSRLRERTTGELLTAVTVPDAKVALIEKEVSRILEKDVHLRQRIMPGIVGGLAVRVDNFVLDGTIDHELGEIRRGLLS